MLLDRSRLSPIPPPRHLGDVGPGSPAPTWVRDGLAGAYGWTRPDVVLVDPARSTSVLVADHGEPVAVTRLVPPGRASRTALESEVAWLRALREAGTVAVPAPVATREGPGVALLEDGDGARWAAVSVEPDARLVPVPGAPDDAATALARLRELGSVAARLHEHSERWTPPSWFRRPERGLTELAGPTSPWGEWEDAPLPRSAINLLGTAQELALDTLSWTTPQSVGLVHGALTPATVRDGLVSGFDQCSVTWYLQDLAASLAGHEHLVAAPSLAAAWLAGYADARPFERPDARVACALVVLGRLQQLARVAQAVADDVEAEASGEAPDDGGPGDDGAAARLVEYEAVVDGTLDVATRYLRSETWLVG